MRIARHDYLALLMLRGRGVADDRIARVLGCTPRGVRLMAESGRRRFGRFRDAN